MAEDNPHWRLNVPALSISEFPVDICVLRVRRSDSAVTKALGKAFALNWPSAPNTMSSDTLRVAWLAPGEWAVFSSAEKISERIARACKGRLHHLADVSAGRRRWRLEGPRCRELIAKGCSLDTDPRVFGAGTCARTLLAHIPILFIPEHGDQVFDIVADVTLAGHLRSWFADAASEYHA
ncbi:sarcosine oxidase subunit gamma [Sphingomonas sp.]|uniref:sarcosine oxidase subunit gamma n=1 Tax=Sphingomonas sp. TaxID=28214 RepID=UPI003D6D04B3